jgi:hypothetical protein
VAVNFPGSVAVIDTATNTVTDNVTVGFGAAAFGNFIGTPPAAAVPGAPTIGTAIAGSSQATVSFTAPANNGGSPITSYLVECGAPAFTASGLTSPITVIGLNNGTSYDCVARAMNAVGTGPASAPVSVTPSGALLPTLTSVVSRKTHGANGTYELLIDRAPSVGGNVTVEPRVMGAGHQIVFKFDRAIGNAGALVVTDSTGTTINTANAVASGNEVIVTLTGNLFAKRVAMSLTAINGNVNASVALGFLLADVNNSRNVNAQDTSRIRARAGQHANSSNFQYDITTSGRITAVDVVVSKVLSGTALP